MFCCIIQTQILVRTSERGDDPDGNSYVALNATIADNIMIGSDVGQLMYGRSTANASDIQSFLGSLTARNNQYFNADDELCFWKKTWRIRLRLNGVLSCKVEMHWSLIQRSRWLAANPFTGTMGIVLERWYNVSGSLL